MIISMTGYGKAVCELPQKKITIEIKSLNSKQLDLNTRLPNIYREKELEIRNDINNKLFRGKVDVSFYIDSAVSEKQAQINTPVIETYYNQLLPLAQKFNQEDRTDFLRIILPLPDSIKVEQADLDETEWVKIKASLQDAIGQLIEFRTQEGAVLEADIRKRIKTIDGLLDEVTPFEKERIEKLRTRIRENLEDLIDKSKIDQNRLEQEFIFYIEKLDVTEEKVRLRNHLNYFIETMDQEEQPGKKLGFIAQEIGREINTLGSKANDANIQRIVIQMKDELEKIKEQMLNVL
ncbi:MAG: YicC/YloC family endoribonuclease [Breznakibacter sp.]